MSWGVGCDIGVCFPIVFSGLFLGNSFLWFLAPRYRSTSLSRHRPVWDCVTIPRLSWPSTCSYHTKYSYKSHPEFSPAAPHRCRCTSIAVVIPIGIMQQDWKTHSDKHHCGVLRYAYRLRGNGVAHPDLSHYVLSHECNNFSPMKAKYNPALADDMIDFRLCNYYLGA